jgi:hypothetical protein
VKIKTKNIISTLFENIKNIIEQSKHYAVTQVNYSLEETIKKVGEKLTLEYGNGFGQRNLFKMMKFYEFFPDITILMTLSAKFKWTLTYMHPSKQLFADFGRDSNE